MNESVISERWSIFLRGFGRLSFLSFFLCMGGIQVCELDKCTAELLIYSQKGRWSIDQCRNFIESYPHPPIRPCRLEHRVVSLCSNLLVANFAGISSVRSKARWIKADSEYFHQDNKSSLDLWGCTTQSYFGDIHVTWTESPVSDRCRLRKKSALTIVYLQLRGREQKKWTKISNTFSSLKHCLS